MSRKQELQSRIVEVQKEYSALSTELKAIQAEEKLAAQVERFKEYKYKVHWYQGLSDKLLDIDADDLKRAEFHAQYKLPVVMYEQPGGTYVLLRSAEELPRVKKLVDIILAFHTLLEKDSLPKREELFSQILQENKDGEGTEGSSS